MEVSEEIVREIIRMHSENGWYDSVIIKVIRRKYDIDITIQDVKSVIKKYKAESVNIK